MEQSSSSEYTISKKEQKTKRNSSKEDFQRQGRWSSQQNLKYLIFLSFNLSKFECKKKRMYRLYKPLSKFINTRNSQQCRSHHRKLLQRFKTPKNIVFNLEQQFQKEEIEQLRYGSEQILKQLPIPQKKMRSYDKQEILSERMEQKNLFIIQNELNKRNQSRQNKSSLEKQISQINQNEVQALNFSQSQEMGIINYQALNWLNQIYGSNINYFFNANCLNYYDPRLCYSGSYNNY